MKEDEATNSTSPSSQVHKRPRMEKRPPQACPQNDDWVLLSQGAEARVWKVPRRKEDSLQSFNEFMIVKERFSKAYRHPILDARLIRQRCRMEGRLLEKCQQLPSLAGRIPRVLRVESPLLYLEYIEGLTVKDFINTIHQKSWDKESQSTCLTKISIEMGRLIGTLHGAGVVHGDLTTSNILIKDVDPKALVANTNNENPSAESCGHNDPIVMYLIDFGLAKQLNQQKKHKLHANTTQLEEMAVDLYVLERALQSTHPQLSPSFWNDLVEAYVSASFNAEEDDNLYPTKTNDTNKNKDQMLKDNPVLKRLDQVRQRGRKRECFG